MKNPWSSARLRSLGKTGGLLFGFMHEDPAPEVALLPPGGSAACVLSAGDIAFALAHARAAQVTAADVNPAQHALVRLKLAVAENGWTMANARNATVGEALNDAGASPWLMPAVADRLGDAAVLDRSPASAGDVDTRLDILARWVTPLLFGSVLRELDQAGCLTGSWRWKFAWQGTGMLLGLIFPAKLRSHLPPDIAARLRRRMESALRAPAAHENPWLHRLVRPTSMLLTHSLASSWPEPGASANESIQLQEAPLDEAMQDGAFDLVATSNIFDTLPAHALNDFLTSVSNRVRSTARVVVRSLFRDLADWPEPPAGWMLDRMIVQRLQALDRSPLCRVSIVLERCMAGG